MVLHLLKCCYFHRQKPIVRHGPVNVRVKINWRLQENDDVYNLSVPGDQGKPQLNHAFTLWVYLGFTMGLLFENLGPLGGYFGFTQGLLWVYLEISFEVNCIH